MSEKFNFMERQNFYIPEEDVDDSGRTINDWLSGDEENRVPPNVAYLINWLLEKYPEALIDELFERGFHWPANIPFNKSIFVSQDDTDGHNSGFWLGFSSDGDAWVDFELQGFDDKRRYAMSGVMRFRTFGGGTKNPRMNAVLRLLALACIKDQSSADGVLIDRETGRPLGWGQMRDMPMKEEDNESVDS